ncbi:cytochrome c oxidase assembly protein [Ectobacillus ponti]|uniref:Cytochrome c oxidase assembly protein n=1 Tax=Ectobacillus ponti TaxID=2961894 RepID=A0AA41X7B0_9BACI|nr:cytochrome c oxidase assembly protein [Ectobacillus ponti]MCP8970057.1 cytochrome c oxidase assembly protein [Ectobacillus ponti]
MNEILRALPFALAIVVYLAAESRQEWPKLRSLCWIAGVFAAETAVLLMKRAHMDFTVHMLVHLLLGMLAPLLLVLAAPVTLLLKTLPTAAARQVTRFLRSPAVQVYHHPVVAALLNIGGLWVLYAGGLYGHMHHSPLLHTLIHIHVLFAGYLFTASIIYIDPVPSRFSFPYRATVFVLALAGHGILTKYIYAHPPAGISAAQAEAGAMLMYYGGDLIDLLLIYMFCRQWFQKAQPRLSPAGTD